MSKQLLRSGTAVGALVREGQNAKSRKDFIHKLAIDQKECDESIYWIELLIETDYLTQEISESLSDDANLILKMIDKGLEPLVDKIQKSSLPTEFNRMKDLVKSLKK